MARLQFTDVQASIDTMLVLRGVSFTLQAGETVAFIGRNGAGKTSLLRTIMGLTTITSGQMLFDGQDIQPLAVHKRAELGIGYVPEDRRMIPKFSVMDNIRLSAWANKMPAAEFQKKFDSICDSLPDIVALKNRTAGQLSGGQQKMAALARSLVCGSKLLLLDEPFQGLAPALAKQYAESLTGLRNQYPDLTIVITESNPALVTEMSNRAYTIERGELFANSNAME